MSANAFDREYNSNVYMPNAMGPLRARPQGVRAALGMGVGASVILAAAALLIRHPAEPQTTADATPPAAVEAPAKFAAKATTDLESTLTGKSAFDIDAPEYEREKKIVAVGETNDGAPRVDSLTIGQFAQGAPFVRIDIHPDLDPKATSPDFFLDMTRHARVVGLNVAKIGQPSMLATRFGAFETAEIRLSQPAAEGAPASERACLATRLVETSVPVEIAGIACGAATKPLDRMALGCALDKLTYATNGDNKSLNDFFLNAELARGKGCANASREDVTASIPPRKTATRAKPAPKKAHAVARSAPVHPEAAKN